MTRAEIQKLVNNLQDLETVAEAVLQELGETEHAISIIDDLSSYTKE